MIPCQGDVVTMVVRGELYNLDVATYFSYKNGETFVSVGISCVCVVLQHLAISAELSRLQQGKIAFQFFDLYIHPSLTHLGLQPKPPLDWVTICIRKEETCYQDHYLTHFEE